MYTIDVKYNLSDEQFKRVNDISHSLEMFLVGKVTQQTQENLVDLFKIIVESTLDASFDKFEEMIEELQKGGEII